MLRPQVLNIPMEIIRTIVAIAETGSMSKAAERLNLSQPSISSQVKRLQGLVGGELFVRTANGTVLTELGKLALRLARRIIDANDQLLRLGGSDNPSVRRLGVSQLFAKPVLEQLGKNGLSDSSILAEHSSEIRRGLVEGFVDVGCLFIHDAHRSEIEDLIVGEHEFETCWVKAKDFVARPGAPIPIVTLPEDDWLIGPLDRNGIAYRIVLRSSDSSVRAEAVRAGFGISAMPAAIVPPDIVMSRDYYLPVLAALHAVVCVREGLVTTDVTRIATRLNTLLRELPARQRVRSAKQ